MRRSIVAFAVTLLLASAVARAQEGALLKVGTKESPPFSVKDDEGRWTGISIELFEEVCRINGWRFEYEERPLQGLLTGLTDGSLDAAVAALTITAEREEKLDFTHGYFETGLGIATAAQKEEGAWVTIQHLLKGRLAKFVGVLLGLLLLVGVLVFLFERRRNREQFGGKLHHGLGAGLWWSAVTMTTVGYGDKAPRTLPGRLVGLLWMFASILLISGFTAAVASNMTVSRLTTPLTGPDELPGKRVATVPNTTSQRYLEDRGIRHAAYSIPEGALEALADDKMDAVVYDAPLLKYFVNRDHAEKLVVLPDRFEEQSYGIALQQGSKYRENANRALLAALDRPWWDQIVERYLGR